MTPLLLLTRQEAAQTLKISLWSLDRLIAEGSLPTVKIPSTKYKQEKNRRVLIAVADLESFIARSREERR